MNIFIKGLLVFGSLFSMMLLKMFYPSYKDDSVVEELVEEVIEYETDIDIDLTPMSCEKE